MLGCILHAVLIGVGLGVTVDSRAEALALLIALSFHQLLEGVSLGAVVAAARFGLAKAAFMLCCYAVTTPMGVAIGIAVAAGYDHASPTSLAVQGTLNGVSAGMLLYIALIQQLSEEFSRKDLGGRAALPLRLALYGSVLLGAGLMAMLAVWA